MNKKERLKKRYHFYRSQGYSAKEANKLKHRSLDVSDIKLNVRKETGKIYVVNNESYRNLSLNNFIVRKKRVKNNSVLSNWGNLTQNDPHKDDMMKHAYNIAKRDNKTLDYGYYYLYLMFTKNLTNEEVKEIAKIDKSFEMYVKGMKPKRIPNTKPKRKASKRLRVRLLNLKTKNYIDILANTVSENNNTYTIDGKNYNKKLYKLVDWEMI